MSTPVHDDDVLLNYSGSNSDASMLSVSDKRSVLHKQSQNKQQQQQQQQQKQTQPKSQLHEPHSGNTLQQQEHHSPSMPPQRPISKQQLQSLPNYEQHQTSGTQAPATQYYTSRPQTQNYGVWQGTPSLQHPIPPVVGSCTQPNSQIQTPVATNSLASMSSLDFPVTNIGSYNSSPNVSNPYNSQHYTHKQTPTHYISTTPSQQPRTTVATHVQQHPHQLPSHRAPSSGSSKATPRPPSSPSTPIGQAHYPYSSYSTTESNQYLSRPPTQQRQVSSLLQPSNVFSPQGNMYPSTYCSGLQQQSIQSSILGMEHQHQVNKSASSFTSRHRRNRSSISRLSNIYNTSSHPYYAPQPVSSSTASTSIEIPSIPMSRQQITGYGRETPMSSPLDGSYQSLHYATGSAPPAPAPAPAPPQTLLRHHSMPSSKRQRMAPRRCLEDIMVKATIPTSIVTGQAPPRATTSVCLISPAYTEGASGSLGQSSLHEPQLANIPLTLPTPPLASAVPNPQPVHSDSQKRPKKKSKYTPEQDAIILELKKQNKSWSEISEAANCGKPLAARNRYQVLIGQQGGGSVLWDAEDLEAFKQMLELGEKVKWDYICAELNRLRSKNFTSTSCRCKIKDLFDTNPESFGVLIHAPDYLPKYNPPISIQLPPLSVQQVSSQVTKGSVNIPPPSLSHQTPPTSSPQYSAGHSHHHKHGHGHHAQSSSTFGSLSGPMAQFSLTEEGQVNASRLGGAGSDSDSELRRRELSHGTYMNAQPLSQMDVIPRSHMGPQHKLLSDKNLDRGLNEPKPESRTHQDLEHEDDKHKSSIPSRLPPIRPSIATSEMTGLGLHNIGSNPKPMGDQSPLSSPTGGAAAITSLSSRY